MKFSHHKYIGDICEGAALDLLLYLTQNSMRYFLRACCKKFDNPNFLMKNVESRANDRNYPHRDPQKLMLMSKYVGLKDGLSYMNSILQQLFMDKEIMSDILDWGERINDYRNCMDIR